MKATALASLLAAAVLSSCASPRSWVYAAEPRQAREPVVNASLVVPPFTDRRVLADNTSALLLTVIPLVPFGFESLTVPEAPTVHALSNTWQFRPADDLARAVAQEIDAARIFRESFTDPRASIGEFLLTGEIRTLSLDSKRLSYGLSIYAPLLWIIGFPAVDVSNEIELHLTLSCNRDGGGAPLWQHTIRGSDGHTGWIYSLGTDFKYDQLLKQQMPAVLASLEQAMRQPGTRAGE